jgi:hypothetical protein
VRSSTHGGESVAESGRTHGGESGGELIPSTESGTTHESKSGGARIPSTESGRTHGRENCYDSDPLFRLAANVRRTKNKRLAR